MKTHMLVLLIFLSCLVFSSLRPASASPQAELHVCASGCAYTTIQTAVDAAPAGAVVKVAAGTYSGAPARQVVTLSLHQAIYINKAITLQGGYTPDNWSVSNPTANVTTVDAQGQGRVVYVDLREASATIDGLHLVNGDATKSGDLGFSGGGVYAWGHQLTDFDSTLTLSNNVISGNTTNADAAGISVSYMNVVVKGNTISNNAIAGAKGNGVEGGGMYLWFTQAQVSGNQFVNNKVPIGDYYGDAGGGLQTMYSTVTLSGNTFQGNQAQQGGGLSTLRSSLTVSGNQFISNTANDGGGLYFGYDTDSTITLSLIGNTFSGNTAADSGGGAYISPYQIDASHNTFDGNQTTGGASSGCNGGGLFIGGTDRVVVDHNTVRNNTALVGGGLCAIGTALVENNLILNNQASSGGGVGSSGQGGDLANSAQMVNNVIMGNTATGSGSAVFVNASALRLIHTTITQNTGGAAAIQLGPNLFSKVGTIALTDTILDHETTGVNATHGYTASLDGVLFSTVTTPFTSDDSGAVTLQHTVSGDPLFDADGYHVQPGSAAIGVAVSSSTARDIDGQARPNPTKANGKADLGADEWYPPLTNLYLPMAICPAK